MSKVELGPSREGRSGGGLKEARNDFDELFGPLATLKILAAKNAGIRGRDAMRLSKAFNKALKANRSNGPRV